MEKVIIVGLGSGNSEKLTREAWKVLSECGEVWLRTCEHPAVSELPADLKIFSFDELYEGGQDLSEVLAQMTERLYQLALRPQGLVYAVPGSPMIGEATLAMLLPRLKEAGISWRIVDGISFIEPVCTALGLDPLPQCSLVDALHLLQTSSVPFPPSLPALICHLENRQEASELKLTLMTAYPDEHPVRLVHQAGTPEELIEDLPLYRIDQSPYLSMFSTLYLPPLPFGSSMEDFQQIIARLRAPDGCPWDRKQTHESLRRFLIEETYEALDALDAGEMELFCEELGDILLQIALHTQIATEDEDFKMSDLVYGISAKMIRRHPHVFADEKAENVHAVLDNWTKIKAEEREDKGLAEKRILDGISKSLPALSQADQIQRRAQSVGFDWDELPPVLAKIQEELLELQKAQNAEERLDEAGDLIFAVVNYIRWLEVEPEAALRHTNAKFTRRFNFIEDEARRQGRSFESLSFDEMNILWEQAKHAPSATGKTE